MKKRKLAFVICASAFLMASCGSPENKIYKTIEETVAIEKDFENQQKPMTELEERENQIFREMMKLGMKQMDKITKLSDEALKNLEKREEYLEKEESAIAASNKEFEKVKETIPKLKDEKLMEKAKELEKLMTERYDAHAQLSKAYKEAIKEDRKLYEMMKNKDLKLEEVEQQIAAANKAQERVIEANKQFNQFTKKFNEEKSAFYKAAGIQNES
ncbi:YkyA family protein [Siminovitchia sp. 179-K 8D1 HS]|uniref:YkyA family protein n=1 Tax=Siminovitchia sp. 179-K 8D1 HS TaxID=3142385 RepID=UPI0039A2189C